jgi:hypothetical protein
VTSDIRESHIERYYVSDEKEGSRTECPPTGTQEGRTTVRGTDELPAARRGADSE